MKTNRLGFDRIEDLEVFVRMVERGSMTAAGVSLGMSTPLVSRRLLALEHSLGVRLVDRTSRMLVLTEPGREFHARAEIILELVREAGAALRVKAGEVRGSVRISLPTADESGILKDFVDLFLKHSELNIEVLLSDRPVDVIGRGLDAAIYLTEAPDRHPGDLMLAQHPTSLAATPGYLDRTGRPTSPEQLSQHRTLRSASSRGKPAPWVLTHVDGREVVVHSSVSMFLSNDLRVHYSAVTNGAGIGRMALGTVAQGAARGELEVVLPDWRFRPMMLAASVRHGSKRSAKISAVLEVVMIMVKRFDMLANATPLADYYRDQLQLCARHSGLPSTAMRAASDA